MGRDWYAPRDESNRDRKSVSPKGSLGCRPEGVFGGYSDPVDQGVRPFYSGDPVPLRRPTLYHRVFPFTLTVTCFGDSIVTFTGSLVSVGGERQGTGPSAEDTRGEGPSEGLERS